MAQHYLQGVPQEARLLVTQHMLENRDKERLYDLISVDILLHPDSPFNQEVRLLFPQLSADARGVCYKDMNLYDLSAELNFGRSLAHIGKYLTAIFLASWISV